MSTNFIAGFATWLKCKQPRVGASYELKVACDVEVTREFRGYHEPSHSVVTVRTIPAGTVGRVTAIDRYGCVTVHFPGDLDWDFQLDPQYNEFSEHFNEDEV